MLIASWIAGPIAIIVLLLGLGNGTNLAEFMGSFALAGVSGFFVAALVFAAVQEISKG